MYIKHHPDHIKEYLDKFRLEPEDGFATFSTLRACLINSFSQISKYKNQFFFLGISDLILMSGE